MLSTSNPKFYKKITKATSRLINSLTDFTESSENHEVCKEYAISQFQHHRFLDVDSHKVYRRLKGLCEKFTVHSQPEKAEILKNLKAEFLDGDISESSKAGSQIHYSLLLILLNLSKNPVNVDYVAPVKVKAEEGEKFDWAKYLLEGEEMPYPSQWACNDTPYESEDEEDSVGRWEDEKNIFPATVSDPQEDEGYSVSGGFQPSINFVPRYWKPSKDSVTSSTTVFTDATTLNIPREGTLGEINVIREVLWLLAGGTNLFVFPYINGKYTVTDKVISSHTTPAAFKSSLMMIAKYGDIVRDILDFVFATARHDCQTYQAFSEALLKFIQEFQNILKNLERRVLLQEETLLLGDLIKILSPRFSDLSEISAVLNNSVNLDDKGDTSSKKSCRLLGALYYCILDQTNKGMISGSPFQDSLIRIWVDTLAPYFKIMDGWMTSGTLIDPYNEFMLRRSTACPDVKSGRFWTEAFSLASQDCLKYLSWLTPVLRSIVVCGKSVEVLVSLGKAIKRQEDATLHQKFVKSIFSHPDKESLVTDNTIDIAVRNEDSTCDGMLRLGFERLFKDARIDKSEISIHFDGNAPFPVLVQHTVSKIVREKLSVSDSALLDVFMNEYGLISTLKCFHKFHLMEWGDVIYDFTSSIFQKMASGEYWMDMMSLHASLQDAITTSDPDVDYSYIAVALNKEKQKSLAEYPLIHETDIVELNFDVKWPLNIVISEKSRRSYNTLFSYILQVKRALFSLEHLKFESVYNKSSGRKHLQTAHRLSLLRTKLLRLVCHWHNFVMTSVIQSEKEAFFKLVESAENVDKIIAAHNRFLDRMLSLCHLKEENQAEKMIQGTLRKIFNLSVKIHTKWNRIETISQESLRKCEAEYKECSDFLGIILQNLVARGAVPLSLESLAFCLMS